MISILLAEAVLQQQGRISDVINSNNDITFYGKEHEFLGTYNIYELAHKCKEWAIENDFCIISATFKEEDGCFEDNRKQGVNYAWAELYGTEKIFRADTEPEAIFKACQWILDEGEN